MYMDYIGTFALKIEVLPLKMIFTMMIMIIKDGVDEDNDNAV